MIYGNKFSKMWESVDLTELKLLWSEKLAKYVDHPECFKYALRACEDNPWPPTLSEFMILCRECIELKAKTCDMASCNEPMFAIISNTNYCGKHWQEHWE